MEIMVSNDGENYAPYAAPANVNEVLARLRQHGLPEKISSADLTRLVGTHTNVAGRVVAALRFLGLVDENGQQTQAMKALKIASAADFPEKLGDCLREAYGPIFSACDPATATDDQLEEAFRFYTPTAQRGRMVTLFVGMCKAAGIVDGRPATRPGAKLKGTPNPNHRPKTTSPPSEDEGLPAEHPGTPPATPPVPAGKDYSLLRQFIDQLPSDGKWTKARHDQWLAAVTATLNLLTEVTTEKPETLSGSGPAE